MNPRSAFFAALACAGCASAVPVLSPGRAPAPAPGRAAEVALVLRIADPVFVRRAGDAAAVPLHSYDKEIRVPAGSSVLVGPGGRADLAFPDGSAVAASGEAALEVLDPDATDGIRLLAHSARRLTGDLRGGTRIGLPGGAVASGDGARFVVRLVGERILRVEGRGSVPVRVLFAGEEVVLDAARSADYPAAGVPTPGGS